MLICHKAAGGEDPWTSTQLVKSAMMVEGLPLLQHVEMAFLNFKREGRYSLSEVVGVAPDCKVSKRRG